MKDIKGNTRAYREITERYCSEVGENVVLRSVEPDSDSYECLHAPFCKARNNCPRGQHAGNDIRHKCGE